MENSSSDKERRKDLRLSIAHPVSIKLKVASTGGILKLRKRKSASPRNISISGILLDSLILDQHQIDRVANGQDKVVLEIEVPYLKKPLEIPGKIVWAARRDKHGKTTYEAGISFEEIKDNDREKLLPFLLNLCLRGKAQT